MSMSIGNATVVIVQHKHNAMHCDAFKGKLEAVLQMIDHGDLGGALSYGCDEHKAALDSVERQIAATRAKIAELEAIGTAGGANIGDAPRTIAIEASSLGEAAEVLMRLNAGMQPVALTSVHPDTVLLDFIASEYLDVSPFAMPTGQGDADVGWQLHQEHEGKKGRVVVAYHYRDDLRAAIRKAMQALAHPTATDEGENNG